MPTTRSEYAASREANALGCCPGRRTRRRAGAPSSPETLTSSPAPTATHLHGRPAGRRPLRRLRRHDQEFLVQQGLGRQRRSTPRPAWHFPGLVPGDRWCVVTARWLQAYEDGVAARSCCRRLPERSTEVGRGSAGAFSALPTVALVVLLLLLLALLRGLCGGRRNGISRCDHLDHPLAQPVARLRETTGEDRDQQDRGTDEGDDRMTALPLGGRTAGRRLAGPGRAAPTRAAVAPPSA
jgi:hypothetical protein